VYRGILGFLFLSAGKIDDILFSEIKQPRLKEAAQVLGEVDKILTGDNLDGENMFTQLINLLTSFYLEYAEMSAYFSVRTS
jgi:hypothetical protein